MYDTGEHRASRRAFLGLALVGAACSGDTATTTSTTEPVTTGGAASSTASAASAPTEPASGGASESASDSQATDVASTAATSTGDATTGSGCSCSDDQQAVVCDGQDLQYCGIGNYCSGGACVPLTPCGTAELLQSSVGCDFWAVKVELLTGTEGACFAAFVANAGDTPVHIAVEYGQDPLDTAAFTRIPAGQGSAIEYLPYDADAGLPPGEVAILFLSRGTGPNIPCPVPPGISQEVQVVGTGRGKAFHITTDHPVAAYTILPYGGGSSAMTSATLLLPTSVWDEDYLAVNAYRPSAIVPEATDSFVAVARADGTEITIRPTAAIVGGDGVPGTAADVPILYTLDRGETLQIAQVEEITGSSVTANKPIGVFGGASCINVPPDKQTCDGAHQQIPPLRALGSTHAAVRHGDRTKAPEKPPWRVVGAVDGTVFTYLPQPPNGAPETIDRGKVAEFVSDDPFLISSQDPEHPFYLAGYMTGSEDIASAGDPEWVNVTPTAQFLDHYVLFTDPTYPETSLVVVRNRANGEFAEVELDCAGMLGGWQPLGDDHEWTRFVLVTGNFQGQGACANGRHTMSSANPFGVTVWGWGSIASIGFDSQSVSYAYPAGAALRKINDVIPPQ